MKTILCPVDSSPGSDRLLKYIANLAKDRNCKVYLLSAQGAQKKELVMARMKRDFKDRLDEIHDYLSGVMGVPCGIVDETLSGNFYKKLGNIADQYDIMVMMIMSSAADGNNNELDLQKVIHDTLIPIMVIPDGFQYQKINRLLFAYDYKHEAEPPLMQLNWLADWFDVEVVFITLLPGDTSLKEENKLISIQNAIKKSWTGNNNLSFETIVYPNLSKGLEHYLGLSHVNDLLVISMDHQSMLERIWLKRVVKGVLQYSKHPYLIIHE